MRHFLERHVGALVAWLVVIIVAIIAMPNTTRLVREYGQTKIPASAQSQVANVMQNQWGRGQGNTRQVVVVFNNGKQPLSSTQKDNIAQTVRNFRDNKKHYHIKSVTAANDNAATRKQLVSKDKSTQLVQLMVGKKDTVRKMNKDISHAAKTVGVKTYVTGSDILNDDFSQATEEGIKKTEVIAAIFIFIVLIIVFRSPIVPLISLFTVGVSVLTSLSVVMNLVDYFNFPLSSFTQVFMVVVLFGIGTDYNILLYDQFKNELSNTDDAVAATRTARKIAGRTILYSGSSILIGFTALALAKFSIYRSAVGVAVGVAILLLVLLTLNPFFMATLGRRMFWPIKTFEAKSDSKLWHGLSKNSVLHPFIALGLVLLVTIPFLFTYSSQLNYDTVDELSDSLPAKQGFQVVQRHFAKGTAEPSTLYIQNNKKLNHEKYLKVIDQVTRKLQKEKGVKTVASVTQPGGSKVNELYVNRQLGTVTGGMKSAGKGLKTINKGLNKASTKLDQSNMQGLVGQMQTLKNGLVDAQGGITKINKGVASADDYLGGLKGSAAAKNFYIPSSVLHGKTFGTAIKTYMSANKKITKMTIVLDSNPSSAKSMARIDALQSEVQNELKGTPLSGAKVAIGGQTATISDTHHIASGDFLRTAAIMLVGILFALMFITRSVLQPFYILGTLLLAYITSLSLTRWLSTAVLDQDMLTWNTPFFSFVMLVALGVDYSIFLMMKYREFGLSDGTPSTRIIAASGVIGAVVISAAIILSGTFAALIPSGVLTLIQVALAVIIGLVILVFILPVVISSLIRLTYPIDDTLNDNIKKRKH